MNTRCFECLDDLGFEAEVSQSLCYKCDGMESHLQKKDELCRAAAVVYRTTGKLPSDAMLYAIAKTDIEYEVMCAQTMERFKLNREQIEQEER